MSTTADADALVAGLRADPGSTVLLFDFDGTLSPTVADPSTARLVEGAFERLADLASRYRTVGLVSGRPVDFLVPLVPPGLLISGQYGLERQDADGCRTSGADRWADASAGALDDLRSLGIADDALEPKGLTLTVHFRTRPEAEAAIRDAVAAVAAARGLAVHDAKRSVELRPPIDLDKGTVVTDLAADASAALYVGDDLGDLPALRAIGRLRSRGVHAVGAAVDGPESPPEVRDEADLVLDGPAGVVELLRRL